MCIHPYLFNIYFAYLSKDLSRTVWLAVEEVQDVTGPLDAVLGRLFSGAEAVVPAAMEILKAGAAILQLIRLPGYYSLLLRYTAPQEVICYIHRNFLLCLRSLIVYVTDTKNKQC